MATVTPIRPRSWSAVVGSAVVVEVCGGLGNQMFQCAAGMALARRVGLPWLIDTSQVDADPKRDYALGRFGDAFAAPGWPWRHVVRCRSRGVTLEHWSPRFDPRLLTHRGGVRLRGHWQSERYFVDASDDVRRMFARASHSLSAMAPGVSRVAIHVRRGDYADAGIVERTHGLLGMDYYQKAVALMRQRVPDATFGLFSDDPAWTREAFRWLGVEASASVTSHDPIDDLARMAQCQHHIIANSTFSWWGAWLAGSAGQVVVAPARWFAQPDLDDTDIVPARWHRL